MLGAHPSALRLLHGLEFGFTGCGKTQGGSTCFDGARLQPRRKCRKINGGFLAAEASPLRQLLSLRHCPPKIFHRNLQPAFHLHFPFPPEQPLPFQNTRPPLLSNPLPPPLVLPPPSSP